MIRVSLQLQVFLLLCPECSMTQNFFHPYKGEMKEGINHILERIIKINIPIHQHHYSAAVWCGESYAVQSTWYFHIWS